MEEEKELPLCSLETAITMIGEACRYPYFRSRHDQLCHLSLFYKNDKQRLGTNEISKKTFMDTELSFKQHITEAVCNEELLPNLAHNLSLFTNEECDFSPMSCPRFQMQYLIDHDRYRGTTYSEGLL